MESKQKIVLEKIRDLIIDTEYENNVYIAGGWCRDLVLGRPSKDVDFVVTKPGGGIFFATWLTKKLGIYKKDSNPVIYGRFATAAFRIDGFDFESVMARKEAYEAGSRKPTVKYGTIQEDVFRRDFTINTLVYNLSNGKIEDITGQAFKDLEEKIIQTPTNPDITFTEDPLRMLRGIRFASTLGYNIDRTTTTSMQKNAKHLQTISYERIRDELSKILMSTYPTFGIDQLTKLGLMNYIIPELYDTIGLNQNKYHSKDVYGHTLDVILNSSPILEVRMAALLHDIGKPKVVEEKENGENSFLKHEVYSGYITKRVLQKLKYDNSFIETVVFLVENHMRLKSFGDTSEKVSDKAIRKLLTDSGDKLPLLLELCHADNLSHSPQYCMPNQIEGLLERIENLKFEPEKFKMPINGSDIMEVFELSEGKEVGQMLDKAMDICLENPEITKDELLNKLKNN